MSHLNATVENRPLVADGQAGAETGFTVFAYPKILQNDGIFLKACRKMKKYVEIFFEN